MNEARKALSDMERHMRLCEAAEDMYEALQAVRDHVKGSRKPFAPTDLAKLDAALAKAEGRS